MRKVTAVGRALVLVLGGASPALALPRLTHTGADYFLMPLLGYLAIIVVCQGAARLQTRPGGSGA